MNIDDILKNIGIIFFLYIVLMIVYLYLGFVSNFVEMKVVVWFKRKLFILILFLENINLGDVFF